MTRQRPEREFYIVISGKFRTLAMFSYQKSVICQEPGSGLWWPLPSSILSCISPSVEFFWLPPPPPPSAKGDSVIAEICLPGVANPRSCGNFYSLSFPPCKKCLMKIFLCTSTVDLLTPRSPGSNTNLTLINTPSAILKVKVSSNSKSGQEGGAFTVKHQYIHLESDQLIDQWPLWDCPHSRNGHCLRELLVKRTDGDVLSLPICVCCICSPRLLERKQFQNCISLDEDMVGWGRY